MRSIECSHTRQCRRGLRNLVRPCADFRTAVYLLLGWLGKATLRRLIVRGAMVGSTRLSLAPCAVPSRMLISRRSGGLGRPVSAGDGPLTVGWQVDGRPPQLVVLHVAALTPSHLSASLAWRAWCLLPSAASSHRAQVPGRGRAARLARATRPWGCPRSRPGREHRHTSTSTGRGQVNPHLRSSRRSRPRPADLPRLGVGVTACVPRPALRFHPGLSDGGPHCLFSPCWLLRVCLAASLGRRGRWVRVSGGRRRAGGSARR
jgi:hypothetical protein